MKIYRIAESITLNDLGAYSEQDIISELVGYKDLDIELPIYPITPEEMKLLKIWAADTYLLDAFKHDSNKESKKIVSAYMKDGLLSDNIIVVYVNNIIDGHHRAVAAIKTNVSLRKVDLNDLP